MQQSDTPEPATPLVLVVDDDQIARSAASLVLRQAGYRTVEASSGRQALDILGTCRCSAVLVDHAMPGMTGLELAGRIRELPSLRLVPIFFLSADDSIQTRLAALRAGASDFMVKPVDYEEMVARIRSHLRMSFQWANEVAALEQRTRVVAHIATLAPDLDARVRARMVCESISESLGGAGVALHLWSGGRARPAPLARAGRHLPPLEDDHMPPTDGSKLWVKEPPQGMPRWREGHFSVCAAIRHGAATVGLLVIGVDGPPPDQLLAAAMDYAATTALQVGAALAEIRRAGYARGIVAEVLRSRAYLSVYQPIIDMRTETTVGFEALTRLADGHPVEGFLADAETAGMRTQCELAFLSLALSEVGARSRGMWMSVNLSPSTLLDCSEDLGRIIDSYGGTVIVELTENERIEDYEAVRQAMVLVGRNAKLAVDDAGSGYASLKHVIDLRPDYLKLDRSWITALDRDEVRQALVGGMVGFCHHTGTELVAEGIELPAERSTLESLGVHLGQGYLLGRPGRLEAARERPTVSSS